MRKIFKVRCTAFEGKEAQVVGMTRKWNAREKMSGRSGKRGRWRERFSSPFIFLFALSEFRGLDHLGAWNRLLLRVVSLTDFKTQASCQLLCKHPYRSDSCWSKYICNNDSPSWTARVFIYCFVNHKMPWKGVYSKLARNWGNRAIYTRKNNTRLT